MPVDLLLLGLIAASLIAILSGFPVAFALGVCAFIYLTAEGFPITMAVLELASGVNRYTILAIPLFMLAGFLMNAARITDRIFEFAFQLVGRIPGGLGHINVVASLIFAGMSGSVLADVAGLGSMEYRAMKQRGYDTNFAVGVTLASAAIGPILPPSVPLVLFGVVAEVSIIGLFLGGIGPGLLIAACLMVYVYLVGRRRGYYTTEWGGWWALLAAFVRALPPLMTPFIIVGGMTLGVFSPTEAATAAVLYALFLAGLVYRDLSWSGFVAVLRETVIATAKLLFIIATALLFGWTLTVGMIPQQLAGMLAATFESPIWFLLLVNITLLLLGAIIENAILLLILAPMLVPVAVDTYGIDPIHFGVVMVFNIMIGQFTPPLGLSLFLMRDITGLSLGRVAWAVAPFLVPLITALMLMTYLPWIVLAIPRALGF